MVIDVQEPQATAAAWANKLEWTIPVLLDTDGAVARTYAPEGVLPEIPREQVPIGSNLIVDPEGKIRFYTLLDSAHFDAKLIALSAVLDELLAAE